MGKDRIIEVARKELSEMTEAEREQLADEAADHLRHLLVGIAQRAFKAMKNGILESDDLTPDF
jgi:phosphoribosyl-ATP pyrophosphohydrolase